MRLQSIGFARREQAKLEGPCLETELHLASTGSDGEAQVQGKLSEVRGGGAPAGHTQGLGATSACLLLPTPTCSCQAPGC